MKKRDSQGDDGTTTSVTTFSPLTTDHVATFNSLKYHIPVGSLIGYGVCFDKEQDGTITAKKHYLESYLNAVVNTVNGLVQENLCCGFFTLIADTLAAINSGDINTELYNAAGVEYLNDNGRYFTINLNPKLITHTQWQEWRNEQAIPSLSAMFSNKKRSDSREHRSNSFQPKPQPKEVNRKIYSKSMQSESSFLTSPESPPMLPKQEEEAVSSSTTQTKQTIFDSATTFEDFKSLFDDKKILAEKKSIEKIEPTFSVALQYMEYMYSTASPNHKKFKKFVDEIVNEYVKIAVTQLKSRDKVPEDKIDTDTIVKNMRAHLLEECAQYLEIGILARKYQKPVRFLHEGNNSAFKFIEDSLIGQLPSGVLALQIVDIQFVHSDKAPKFFKDHPIFFNPRPSPETKKKRSPPIGTAVSVPPANVIINVSIYLQGPETSQDDIKNMMTLLAPAIQAKQKRATTSKSEGTKATYAFSSPRPAFDELVTHLLKFFYSEDTTLEALESFQTFLQARLDLARDTEDSYDKSFN